MRREELQELLNRYLAGECTPSQKRMVETWFNQLSKEENELPYAPDWDIVKETIYDRLPQPKRHTRSIWLSVAAAVVLLVIAGVLHWKTSPTDKNDVQAKTESALKEANQIMLTLSDGKTLVMDKDQQGIRIDNMSIRYLDGNYPAIANSTESFDVRAGVKLSTPIGQQFRVVFEDETEVLLNAASTLSCPKVFSNDRREVHLDGEAFFKVSKNKDRPFYVKTLNQEIKVLGTSFGVSAFAEDETVKTTLVSGSVLVQPKNTRLAGVELSPGEQSILAKDKLRKEHVDTDSELSWLDGSFSFKSDDIQSVMKMLQRWYDIEVHYEGQVSKERFNGVIPRSESIDPVLELLEKTKSVRFKKEGRRITVMQ